MSRLPEFSPEVEAILERDRLAEEQRIERSRAAEEACKAARKATLPARMSDAEMVKVVGSVVGKALAELDQRLDLLEARLFQVEGAAVQADVRAREIRTLIKDRGR